MNKVFELISAFLNVLAGGQPDESYSARAHREKLKSEPWIDRVMGTGHCYKVHQNTKARQLSRYGVTK